MHRFIVSRLFLTLSFMAAAQFAAMNANAGGQPSGVDWKLYGSALSNMCFYDAEGLTHLGHDHVRVWTKCLRQKDLDSIDIEKDYSGKILERTAQKVAKYYVPPIASVEESTLDQLVAVTQYEVTANLARIEPQASIFYELNCQEKMIRELSLSVKANGKSGSSNNPSPWRYVAPETNSARLLNLLCPSK